MPLQIDNSRCSLECVRVASMRGGREFVPEKLIAEVARRRGGYFPGIGTYDHEVSTLLKEANARSAYTRATVSDMKDFLSSGYQIRATVWAGRGKHSVLVYDIVTSNYDGQLHVLFDCPYVGKRIDLPACDFEKLLADDFVHVMDFGQVHRSP